MKHETIIIGAGQCGLAMSKELSARSVDHLILERGAVANAWRTERWDSLRLLTPNWMAHLPGAPYRGMNPDGFLSMPEVVRFFSNYARDSAAPVRTGVTVTNVGASGDGYVVETDSGCYTCRNVVMATGACRHPVLPACAAGVPGGLPTLTAFDYKRPSDLPGGRVLVVGGSATGVQIARELQLSGREVVLSVGEHVRVPRRYCGQDIKWWMHRLGLLDQRIGEVDDPVRVRRTPSLQLAGLSSDVDLNALSALGVEVVGRLADIREGKAVFSGGLANHCALADLKMHRLLDQIDDLARERAMSGEVQPEPRPAPTRIAAAPRLSIDLTDGTIGAIVWATGFRPDFSWLGLPVFDRRGRLAHAGGVVAPGLYTMGLPFMRRRNSTLIGGAGQDAAELADHMIARLDQLAA